MDARHAWRQLSKSSSQRIDDILAKAGCSPSVRMAAANRSRRCGQIRVMTLSDEEVVEGSLRDPGLFGLVFDRHFNAIAQFCIRRVGGVQGEDLAGDVFMWAFANRHRFDPERGAVRSWLFRVANNEVRHAMRSAGRQSLAYVRWSRGVERQGTDLATEVVSDVDAENDLFAVAAVLDLRPIEEVETLLLFAWEELSYAEIAEVLAVPIGTVRSRINRIRHHLRDVRDAGLVQPERPIHLLGGLQ